MAEYFDSNPQMEDAEEKIGELDTWRSEIENNVGQFEELDRDDVETDDEFIELVQDVIDNIERIPF